MAAEIAERIGTRIRERREELGLSRPALVRRMAGLATDNDLYRWETGRHKPHDDKLKALAEALEVETSYFYSAPAPVPGAVESPPPPKPAAASDVAALYALQQENARKLDAIMAHLGVKLPEAGDEVSGLPFGPSVAGARRRRAQQSGASQPELPAASGDH